MACSILGAQRNIKEFGKEGKENYLEEECVWNAMLIRAPGRGRQRSNYLFWEIAPHTFIWSREVTLLMTMQDGSKIGKPASTVGEWRSVLSHNSGLSGSLPILWSVTNRLGYVPTILSVLPCSNVTLTFVIRPQPESHGSHVSTLLRQCARPYWPWRNR